MIRGPRESTVKKYVKVLIELYSHIENGKLSGGSREFLKQNAVGSQFLVAAVDCKILERRGGGIGYKWVSRDYPNKDMAKKLAEKIQEYNKGCASAKHAKDRKANTLFLQNITNAQVADIFHRLGRIEKSISTLLHDLGIVAD